MSVAFVREESAEAAQEVSLPLRAISAHPMIGKALGPERAVVPFRVCRNYGSHQGIHRARIA
jgi:hypothetical protein